MPDPALPSILLVDDDPGMIRLMGRVLAGMGRLRFATDGESALQQMRDAPPDLVMLDGQMPGLDGFAVCAHMKRDPALAHVPVIFVTGDDAAATELRGLEAGAVDFIAKPIREPLLVARVRTQLRVKRLADELRNAAATDPLTGLANRRSFDESLAREWRRVRRTRSSIALLLVDVDHFKRYNDHYGHPAGDLCLQRVGAALRAATLRPGDCVARIGGEEFGLLLPDTEATGATHVAERVREQLAAMALPHAASPTAPSVTVSIGIACIAGRSFAACGDGESVFDAGVPPSAQELIRCADESLYAAKGAGRARAWIVEGDAGRLSEAVPREALPPAQHDAVCGAPP
jgi:diguanylate cyclase (GGDEF)-like protein